MSKLIREKERWSIAKAILADALVKGILAPDGSAVRGEYSTVLEGGIPAAVRLSYLSAPPSGTYPPEAYLYWTLWPNEPAPRPCGHFNVSIRHERWVLIGVDEYRRAAARADALKCLPDYAKIQL